MNDKSVAPRTRLQAANTLLDRAGVSTVVLTQQVQKAMVWDPFA
jgi:hypothetical protein